MLPKSFSFWSLAMRSCWICSILTCRASTSPSSLLFSVFSQLSSGSSAAWNKKMTQDPFFTLPFTVPNKRHAAQAALQIWDKAIGQLFASYHFPLNNKERDTKKVSEEGILFCLAHSAALFSAPGRQKAVHYIQSRGHFFIDRNNGISYCSGAPVIQVEFIQEVCRGSWRMKGRSPCQAGRERWMEEEGEGGGIGGSPWAPFPFGEGGRVVVFVFLPASVSEITSAVIALKPAGREPHGVHQVSVMSIQAVRINTPFACLSHLGAYSRSKAFKRKGFFFFCLALVLLRSLAFSVSVSLSASFIRKAETVGCMKMLL